MKKQKKKNRGFTLVEVLICVGIIGIIAAITIPAILSSTSEKALETQRKALQSRMSQAFGQIKNLKMFEKTSEDEDTGDTIDNGSALEFLINGLSKVYKITSICKVNQLSQCGIPDSISDYYSDTEAPYTFVLKDSDDETKNIDHISKLNENITDWGLDTSVAGFKTANGESILLFYNPKCKSKKESEHNLSYSVCVNMVYDLNGRSQAPNAYGEDIGVITVFYPTDSTVVMPILYHNSDGAYSNSGYQDMLSKAAEKELAPPTIEELISILINKNLTKITKNIDTSKSFWSSSYSSSSTEEVWTASFNANGIKLQSVAGGASKPYFLIKK